ncbi:4-coumarate--CoA ligase-like 9 isoform X2 [Malania oleifera]|uniref:4-coumarate--CoA ligase-like 9 isoform X2 n=1 Tax=Malania oleifera TaxID=397392 RepID=UPI0025AE29BD|nr:4-coumarate--CoA ligase-like 9 isoform X2 [Malania oleifera]
MANPNLSNSPIDPNSGFSSETLIYHSLRPHVPLPPQTIPLSVCQFALSLLSRQTSAGPAGFIDAATGTRIPYSELPRRTETLAAFLQNRVGLSRGDSAFVLSPNSIRVPVLYLSLFSLGVIVSPSNPAATESEIAGQIQLCKPAIAFATSETVRKLPSLRLRTILLDSPEFDSAMMSPGEKLNPVRVAQSNTAAILYSSGTTGRVKGVELTHRNWISTVAAAHAVRPVRTRPVVSLCAVPYFHVYGFAYCVRAVALGESVVSMERFDLRLMMRAIEGLRVTHVAVAPPIVVAMLRDDHGDLMDGYDLSSLEVVACGGALLQRSVIERFKKRFPNVQMAQAYGLTESTAGVYRTMGPKESQVIGAVGRLMSNCQAKIVDPDTDTGLPPHKQGELWLRGPSIMKGYVDDQEATAAILDSEGWLRTGDICYIDNEGFLFFVDRMKELIKYKGYQVAPAELEHMLQTHPDIVEAAVIPYVLFAHYSKVILMRKQVKFLWLLR